ncbi:MAG: pantetheine-phosphate adenylyltransferase [Phycisphaerales bacterium]|nr:pantetheine-phosphate adenylyltransferase [Phycisphaerales bacterium]
MHNANHTIAVFPGTFDPVTIGHVDLIRRAAAIFPRVIVGVGENPTKTQMFSPEERVGMIRELLHDLPNVIVRSYTGLTMQFVKEVNGKVILRGIRDTVDLRDELQFANANLIVGDVETVFLMATDQHALTSSTLIKQIVELGGAHIERLSHLVPPAVLNRLKSRLRPKA